MKFIISLLTTVLLLSCSSKKNDTEPVQAETAKPANVWDSLITELKDPKASKIDGVDISTDHFDTTNINASPIQFISVDTSRKSDPLFPRIKKETIVFRIKNVGNKVIEGTRFRWYCENAFGEPELLFTDNYSRCIIGQDATDERMEPGEEAIITWTGYRGKIKVKSAWAYQVAFSDGTQWKIAE